MKEEYKKLKTDIILSMTVKQKNKLKTNKLKKQKTQKS